MYWDINDYESVNIPLHWDVNDYEFVNVWNINRPVVIDALV
jgi:hypothetical protein